MGLLSSRNLRKAKSLLEQNRHKVGDLVGKATEQVDKVSKGKTSNVSAKVEEAARKYSAGGVTHHDAAGGAVGATTADTTMPPAGPPLDEAELQRRQAEANIAAANALKSAADAAASVFGKMTPGTPAPAASTSDDESSARPTAEPDSSPPAD